MELDQEGGVGEEVTADQVGSPEREIEVTVQPRAAATLQMREPEGGVSEAVDRWFMHGWGRRWRSVPRKPLPPQTTSFLAI